MSSSPNLKKFYRGNKKKFDLTYSKHAIKNLEDFLERFNHFRYFNEMYPQYLFNYFSTHFNEIYFYFEDNFKNKETGYYEEFSIFDFYKQFYENAIINSIDIFLAKYIISNLFNYNLTVDMTEFAKDKYDLIIRHNYDE